MKVFSDDDLVGAFLTSDPKLWVREHKSFLQRRAGFKLEQRLEILDDIVRFEAYIVDGSNASENSQKIHIDFYLVASIPFKIGCVVRSTVISPGEQDISKSEWSNMDDEIVRKVFDISRCAHHVVDGVNLIS